MVGRPSRRAGSGREALPAGCERLGGPPGGTGVDGSPSQRAKLGQEAIPDSQEWSGGPPGGLGMVGRPSRRAGSPLWRVGSSR